MICRSAVRCDNISLCIRNDDRRIGISRCNIEINRLIFIFCKIYINGSIRKCHGLSGLCNISVCRRAPAVASACRCTVCKNICVYSLISFNDFARRFDCSECVMCKRNFSRCRRHIQSEAVCNGLKCRIYHNIIVCYISKSFKSIESISVIACRNNFVVYESAV